MAGGTALIYAQECLRHHTGTYHPETMGRLPAILRAIDEAGLALPRIACAPATRDDLLRNHSAGHIDKIAHHCRSGELYPDRDTVMGPGSWDAALQAAGAGIAGCKAVLAGEYKNVFCAVRPPGHHAEPDRAMGFCLFNNIAVAAHWLRAEAGLSRIAIFDWDVHHGNGTQDSFHDEPCVHYISIHEFPLYPGTGMPTERGLHGNIRNIAMPPGSGPDAWLNAVKLQVAPALRQFNPEFLLISAGFDAHRSDPLASQMLEAETYAEIFALLRGIADDRVVAMLEGGYDLDALGESVVCTLRAMQAVK